MRAREGDLVKTSNNIIFDVKGLVHPPGKIVAFPRYIPTTKGTRGRGGKLYGKIYSLSERFKYLGQNAPQFIVLDTVFDEKICEVPISDITTHFKPVATLFRLRKASRLADLERKAIGLAECLKEAADIPWSTIGISGSIMAGLYTLQSDIDPVVYGLKNCRKAYAALKTLLEDGGSGFNPYSKEELRMLFQFRSKDTIMDFEEFARVESRKAFQGRFGAVDYFVRFVKEWSEIGERYGDVCYRNSGYAKVTGTVADDSDALFTPCSYKLENVKVVDGPKLESISEVVSFRGRFCQQARTGEKIVAQGKVENAKDTRSNSEHYRLIIGNKPEDYMALSKT